MGMQVSSLYMGDPASYNRELPREKRPALLGEQRFSHENLELGLRGSKSQAPDLAQVTANLNK